MVSKKFGHRTPQFAVDCSQQRVVATGDLRCHSASYKPDASLLTNPLRYNRKLCALCIAPVAVAASEAACSTLSGDVHPACNSTRNVGATSNTFNSIATSAKARASHLLQRQPVNIGRQRQPQPDTSSDRQRYRNKDYRRSRRRACLWPIWPVRSRPDSRRFARWHRQQYGNCASGQQLTGGAHPYPASGRTNSPQSKRRSL